MSLNTLCTIWIILFLSEVLVGAAQDNYGLVSAIQVEEGPRLFHPHFGFYYKALNTRVKVIFVETSSGTQHEIMNSLVNAFDNEIERIMEWRHFSQNLSDVSFLSTAWSGNTKIEWQVKHFSKTLSKLIHLVLIRCSIDNI